jgi:hypothetical protein
MFLPPEYAQYEPVIIAAVVVFIITWIANTITFSNRVISAFLSGVLFAIVFGALVYFGYGSVQMTFSATPSVTAPANR